VWTIPGPRRKGKKGEERPLAVPLSDRCMEILSATEKRPGRVGLIFSNEGRRLGQNILNVTIARLGYPCVGHGFRSTFGTGAAITVYNAKSPRRRLVTWCPKSKVTTGAGMR
jgi:hypothetical protein